MNKLYYILFFAVVFSACETVTEPGNLCSQCEIFPGEYVTDVKYSNWDFVDGGGGVLEYFEDLQTTNEFEVILTDFDSKTFQLNSMSGSFGVDVPATLSDDGQSLEFDFEITRDFSTFRTLTGFVRFSSDSVFVESTLVEKGHYGFVNDFFESYFSAVGLRK